MSIRYIWETGKPNRVMHIGSISQVGDELLVARCGIPHQFNRSINAPFGLGRKICKKCRQVVAEKGLVSAS